MNATASIDPRGLRPADPASDPETLFVQALLLDPHAVLGAFVAVPAELIGHTGLRRIVAELYAIADDGRTPDLVALKVRLRHHPELYQTAVELHADGVALGLNRAEWGEKLRRLRDAFRLSAIVGEESRFSAQHFRRLSLAGFAG